MSPETLQLSSALVSGLLILALGFFLGGVFLLRRNNALRGVNRQLQDSLYEAELKLAEGRLRQEEALNYRSRSEELQRELSQVKEKYAALEAQQLEQNRHHAEKIELLQSTREQMRSDFEALANKVYEQQQLKFQRSSESLLRASFDPLREQLKDFRSRVETVYDKESADRNRLFGQITELQKQARQISEDAVNLTNALRGDNKQQGNWGEVILERVLEDSGLRKGHEYETQVAYSDAKGKRRLPDVVIRLPEDKALVIDAKVSLVEYERYCCADDEKQRAAALRGHLASLKAHIQGLSAKEYQDLEGIRSLDFVFIFIPVEGAFLLALEQDQSLFRDAYHRNVILVSPSTLLATLRTVENLWRLEKQNRNAEEIARQAGGLYDQFVLLLDALKDVGSYLDKVGAAYETSLKRLSTGRGNLLRRTQKLKQLGAKTSKSVPAEYVERLDVTED